jgi:hypothetical protein
MRSIIRSRATKPIQVTLTVTMARVPFFLSSAISPSHYDKSASRRPITGQFCLFWGCSKVTPFVTKKNRKKGPLFEGKKALKKEGLLGKATKQIGKNKRNEDQTRAARST